MSKIKLTGETSGYTELKAAASAGNNTISLPANATQLAGIQGDGGLNVSGGVTSSGIITAASFSGSGLNLTDVTVSNNLSVSGVSTLGVSTFTGNVSFASSAFFGDSDKILLGADNDFEIYHDGSDGYIDNSTGELYIRDTNAAGTNRIFIQPKAGENAIIAKEDGNVELYHDNSKKLETTNHGAVVTGICTATSFSGSGSGLTNVGAWTFMSEVNVTSTVATVNITNITGYDTYAIVCSNWMPFQNTGGPSVRYYDGSSYVASTVNSYSVSGMNGANFSGIAQGSATVMLMASQSNAHAQNVASYGGCNFVYYLFNASNSNTETSGMGQLVNRSSGSYVPACMSFSHHLKQTGTVTGMQFYFDTGQTASGLFRLYGISNS